MKALQHTIIAVLGITTMLLSACSEKANIDNPGSNALWENGTYGNKPNPGDTTFIDAWDLIDIPAGAITAKEAYKIGKELAPGTTKQETYQIYGYISKLGARNGNVVDGGRAYYYIKTKPTDQEEFYLYGVKWLNNTDYASTDQQDGLIYVGQRVVIKCKIQNYSGTIENANGDCYVTSSSYRQVLEGEGTYEKPYTVNDILKMGSRGQGKAGYFTGYIVGSNSNTEALSAESLEKSNFSQETNVILAASADEYDVQKMVPAQLQKETMYKKVREGLNLKSNPANMGQQVLLYGELTTYMGQYGIWHLRYAKVGETEIGTKQ